MLYWLDQNISIKGTYSCWKVFCPQRWCDVNCVSVTKDTSLQVAAFGHKKNNSHVMGGTLKCCCIWRVAWLPSAIASRHASKVPRHSCVDSSRITRYDDRRLLAMCEIWASIEFATTKPFEFINLLTAINCQFKRQWSPFNWTLLKTSFCSLAWVRSVLVRRRRSILR